LYYHLSKTRNFALLFLIILMLTATSCDYSQTDIDLSRYEFRDTKKLVKFAYHAAEIIRKKGITCIDSFKKNRDNFGNNDFYLYIYKFDGENLFHAGIKEFEGQNLADVLDLDGKAIHKSVITALENKKNPHAWVHYNWWKPKRFYPVPKSSCHFKVITDEGGKLYVGAGMDFPHEEKEFIRIIVDTAVDLIQKKGKEALEKLKDPTSQFIYREVRVFVFDDEGKTLISPVLNYSPVEINFLESKDAAGHKPFERALTSLKDRGSTWEVFLAKSRSRRILLKKILYLRKIKLNDEIIYVGAVTDMPEPAWTN